MLKSPSVLGSGRDITDITLMDIIRTAIIPITGHITAIIIGPTGMAGIAIITGTVIITTIGGNELT
jgi:hypothetical protein